ncbi:hypothetical protein KL86PLE_90333 [uncultured Pleomorphomonas sp.]|uniref:Uncharacterized protein n=1 Tax=uncultured Pleomorphomonas sp. TaxID=442121 RepID=A0A212LP86_9HYPH|nr:hypothetical protein KL86PLE_90333 [uncultured Pleomorphomonas sp.]
MLTTSDALANTFRVSHDFSDQAAHIIAIGNIVAVPTMIGEQNVTFSIERRHKPDRAAFLSNAGMNCSAQFTLGKQFEQAFLDKPDSNHLVQQPIRPIVFLTHKVTRFYVTA